MSRIVYLNGLFVDEGAAHISVFDRGFLMADGVYEVTAVLDGRLIDFDAHISRLGRSLEALNMQLPAEFSELRTIHGLMIEKNRLRDGLIYLQITRGNPGDRDFTFPEPERCAPTIVLFTQSKPGLRDIPVSKTGIKVMSVPDLRWRRRDIKTTQLLYPSMAKMMAKKANADDAWLVEDGLVTEGTSSNAWIVQGKTLVTRQKSDDILHGITRAAVLTRAIEDGLAIEERPFSPEEARAANEAFQTSAAAFVMPVVCIDDTVIGDGRPGPVTRRLRALYLESARR